MRGERERIKKIKRGKTKHMINIRQKKLRAHGKGWNRKVLGGREEGKRRGCSERNRRDESTSGKKNHKTKGTSNGKRGKKKKGRREE